MKRYEIIIIDDLYCIFFKGRMISAFETMKEAKVAVEKYKEKEWK